MPFSLISLLIPFCRLMIRLPPPHCLCPSILAHSLPPFTLSSIVFLPPWLLLRSPPIANFNIPFKSSISSLERDFIPEYQSTSINLSAYLRPCSLSTYLHPAPDPPKLGFFLLPPFLVLSFCIHRHLQSSAPSLYRPINTPKNHL